MSEQSRSFESSPIDWVPSSFMLPADEAEELLDRFVRQETSSQNRDEGSEGASLSDFKAGAVVVPSDVDDEPPEKRPYREAETISSSSEPPKKRKKKPKGLPKRALSGYNCFFSAERLKIQQEIPGIDFEELGRVVGRRWNELSEEEREPYNLLAKEDSVRYHNEMEAFKKRKEEEQKASYKKNEEKAGRSQSSETESSSTATPTACTTHACSTSNNFQTSQVPADSSSSLSNDPNQAGGSGLCWNIQQPSLPSGPPINSPQSSGRSSAFQPAGWQPSSSAFQPNAYSFLPGCFPVPPGLEIFLPDATGRERKYTVQYTWQSMTRESAEQFMESFMQPPRNMLAQFQGFNQQYMPPPQARGPPRHPPGMMQSYQAPPPPPPRGFHQY